MDSGWIRNIAKISMQAMEEKGLSDIVRGKVLSISPLQIQMDQKSIVSKSQVTVPEHLTDHTETMAIPGIGKAEIMVYGALKTGDQVLMIQALGGQHFTVIDRWKGG